MLFNSHFFVFVFLPATLALWWLSPRTGATRLAMLVVASYVFYGWWDWRFCGLMAVSTLLDHQAGLGIARSITERARRGWLTASVALNLALLAAPGYEAACVDETAHWLTEERRAGRWNELWLTGIDVADPMARLLREGLARGGVPTLSVGDRARWACPLPESFDAYLANLGKSSRRLVRTVLKRLDGGGSFELCVADDEPSRVTLLRVDGEPAAAAVAATLGGTLSVYLTDRDPAFDDRRPGWMLNFALVRDAIGRGCHTLDLLRGDEAYKRRLGARPAPQAPASPRDAGRSTVRAAWRAGGARGCAA